jgi:hypothetical protein
VSTNPIVSESGHKYTLVVERNFSAAQILNELGSVVGSMTGTDTKNEVMMGVKKFLAESLNCKFAVDTLSHNVVVDPTNEMATELTLEFDDVPNSGHLILEYNSNLTAPILSDDDDTDLTAKLNAVLGLEDIEAGGDFATDFVLDVTDINEDPNNLNISENTLMIMQEQNIAFDEVADEGTVEILYGDDTVVISFDDLAADVQTTLRTISALSEVLVTGDTNVGFLVQFVNVVDPESLDVGDSTLKSGGIDVETTIDAVASYTAISASISS